MGLGSDAGQGRRGGHGAELGRRGHFGQGRERAECCQPQEGEQHISQTSMALTHGEPSTQLVIKAALLRDLFC